MKPGLPRLHAVTDERIARRPDLADLVSALAFVKDDRLAFHARGRTLSGLAHWELADRLSARPPVRCFVNDRLDVALAVGADGVQLPGESLSPAAARVLGPGWWIGNSVHDLAEARTAQAEGADYLLVGPVFPTATHPGAVPLGIAALRGFVELGCPVIAIGGVTPERTADLVRLGVYGVAAIRALWDAPQPEAAAGAFLEALG